ncbi:hypothetical protein [Streptomyces sp. Rer75]|nr:hypothetical protein [Streptomyces sp. Rer75]QLH26372.1 hypothetical protein HYQ63_41950 [Streptomyces sp. Rer75]
MNSAANESCWRNSLPPGARRAAFDTVAYSRISAVPRPFRAPEAAEVEEE